MVTAYVDVNTFVITVSWQVCIYLQIVYVDLCECICIYIQAPVVICTANITMYNITVMDQYRPANVTVPANMSSVEISEFPDNGTSIVANREYNITVSAVSDQGTSYPSDPIVVSKYSYSCYLYVLYVATLCTRVSMYMVCYRGSSKRVSQVSRNQSAIYIMPIYSNKGVKIYG